METEENQPEKLERVFVDEEALRKLLAEVKSNDLTESQFEQEKTKRIVALAGALEAVATETGSTGYGERSPRAQIMEHLTTACHSQYRNGNISTY